MLGDFFYVETSKSNFVICEKSEFSATKLSFVSVARNETQAKRLVSLLNARHDVRSLPATTGMPVRKFTE